MAADGADLAAGRFLLFRAAGGDEGEGPSAGTPDSYRFHGPFWKLWETTAEIAGKAPVALLVTIDRASVKVGVDFEYDDPERWRVTPANVDALPGEMRPGRAAQ